MFVRTYPSWQTGDSPIVPQVFSYLKTGFSQSGKVTEVKSLLKPVRKQYLSLENTQLICQILQLSEQSSDFTGCWLRAVGQLRAIVNPQKQISSLMKRQNDMVTRKTHVLERAWNFFNLQPTPRTLRPTLYTLQFEAALFVP